MYFFGNQFLSCMALLISMFTTLTFAGVVMNSVNSGSLDTGSSQGVGSSHMIHKKSFSSIGCLGTFDRSKFARLDRICEECYQIYRDQEIQTSCREFCFKNDVFPACVDALMLSHEQKQLSVDVDELLGR